MLQAADRSPRRLQTLSRCHIVKFADDTAVVGCITNSDESGYRQEVEHLEGWCRKNNLCINIKKTKEMIVDFRRGRHAHLPLHVGGSAVEVVSSYRYLGVHLSNNLTWSNNTSSLVRKAHQRLYFLRRLRRAGLGSSVLTSFYRCVVESVLCSSINVWHGSCSAADRKALQRVVKAAQRNKYACPPPQWSPTFILEIYLSAAVHCNLSQNGIDHQVCTEDVTSNLEEEPVDHVPGLDDDSPGFQDQSPGFQHRSPPQRSVSESELSRIRHRHLVLFTGESRFYLSTCDRRDRLWRRRGEYYAACNIIQHDWFGGGSVMVWGGIFLEGRTDLYRLDNGTLTAIRYQDEILGPVVRPYAGAVGPGFLLVHNNAQPHVARVCRQFLENEGIDTIDWPTGSPDLNPIEHLWDTSVLVHPKPP
ncbi:hypothetical protein NFI96_002525, partial [Prochilodus magdalenae]